MLEFAQRHAISDLCFLVEDADRSVAFYVDRLGFRLLHRAPGFADFSGAGVTLAVWEIGHISRTTGVSGAWDRAVHKAVAAVKLPSPAEVDACYAELSAKGVEFQAPPADYPWNARGCYFAGPDGELWELYAWHEGGAVGKVG
jgi:catechol 2,3-dioxygenase-like lactoylglutathione lyase family enzyme